MISKARLKSPLPGDRVIRLGDLQHVQNAHIIHSGFDGNGNSECKIVMEEQTESELV